MLYPLPVSQLQRGSDLVRYTLALGADAPEHNQNFQNESGAEQSRNVCAAEFLEQLGPPASESITFRDTQHQGVPLPALSLNLNWFGVC